MTPQLQHFGVIGKNAVNAVAVKKQKQRYRGADGNGNADGFPYALFNGVQIARAD